MEQNRDMEKIVASTYGTPMKVKLILAAALIIMGLFVTTMTFNIFEKNASFVKDCTYREESFFVKGTIESEKDAIKALGAYANTDSLVYDKYPVEYDESCHSKQYFFQDNRTSEKFFVCKTGAVLHKVPINCSMDYNFSVVDSASKMFQNKSS
jgi:hypothetical protein